VITVTVKNAQGEPIAASNVELFSSRNEADMGVVDTLSAPSGTSTTEGVVTFHMTSTTTGSAVLTATATDDLGAIRYRDHHAVADHCRRKDRGAGWADDVGVKARFDSPSTIVLDSSGENLIVSDIGNSAIRKISFATAKSQHWWCAWRRSPARLDRQRRHNLLCQRLAVDGTSFYAAGNDSTIFKSTPPAQ